MASVDQLQLEDVLGGTTATTTACGQLSDGRRDNRQDRASLAAGITTSTVPDAKASRNCFVLFQFAITEGR